MEIWTQVTATIAVQQNADKCSTGVILVQLKSTFLRSYKQKMDNKEGTLWDDWQEEIWMGREDWGHRQS